MEKYKEYRVYISSSDYEGNSKSTLEALGYGCLVITKDIENNSEIISNNISSFFISGSTTNLTIGFLLK